MKEVPAKRPTRTWKVKFTNSSKRHGVICLESAEYEGGNLYPWQQWSKIRRLADPWSQYPWTKIDMPPNACVTITQEETMRRGRRRAPRKALFYKDDKTGRHRLVWSQRVLIHPKDSYDVTGTSPPIPGPDEYVLPVENIIPIPDGEVVIDGQVVKSWVVDRYEKTDIYSVCKKIDYYDRSYDVGDDLDDEAKSLSKEKPWPKMINKKEPPSGDPRPRSGEHRPQ